MNLTAVVALTAGVVLMYSAVKGKDPRDVVRNALGKKDAHAELKPLPKVELKPIATDGTKIVTV